MNAIFTSLSRKLKRFIIDFPAKKKLTIILLIQIILFTSIGVYLLITSFTDTIQQYKNSDVHAMAGYTQKIDNALLQMKEISLFPIQPMANGQYKEIYSYLEKGATFVEDYGFANSFLEKAKAYLDITSGFDMIAMYDSTGVGLYCFSGSSVQSGTYCALNRDSSAWYQQTIDNRGGAAIIPSFSFTGSGIPQADHSILCVSRSVIHIGRYDSMGILILGMTADTLNRNFELYRASANEDYLLLYDSTPVAGNPSLFGSNLESTVASFTQSSKTTRYLSLNSGPVMVNYYPYDDHLSMITVTPLTDIFGKIRPQNFGWIILFFLLLVVMFLFTFFVTSSINHSIETLTSACSSMEQENFEIMPFPKTELTGEFGVLFSAFSHMSEKISYLIHEILQKDLEKRDIELYALRSQINSHYLNNTLESIRMKAYTQGNYDLAEMARLLGFNLQYNLKEIDDEVTIEEELESVRNYIRLIQFNYADGITFSIHVEQPLMKYKIMKFVLQPIIENTISHALGSTPHVIHIDIMGYSDDQSIILMVTDDGNGIAPSRLAEIQKALNGEPSTCTRIGLKNINRRIKLFYGEAYGVNIRSKEHMGTTTSICIPLIRKE